jgi:hypothetical protein
MQRKVKEMKFDYIKHYDKVMQWRKANQAHWPVCRIAFTKCVRCQVLYGNMENIDDLAPEIMLINSA